MLEISSSPCAVCVYVRTRVVGPLFMCSRLEPIVCTEPCRRQLAAEYSSLSRCVPAPLELNKDLEQCVKWLEAQRRCVRHYSGVIRSCSLMLRSFYRCSFISWLPSCSLVFFIWWRILCSSFSSMSFRLFVTLFSVHCYYSVLCFKSLREGVSIVMLFKVVPKLTADRCSSPHIFVGFSESNFGN